MSFYPSTVVIGGGIGRQPTYFDAVSALVQRRFDHYLDVLTLVPGSLGDDAGLAGAAAWDQRPCRERRADPVGRAGCVACRAGRRLARRRPIPCRSRPRASPHGAPEHHGGQLHQLRWRVMDQFRSLAAAGHGPVGVILPNSYTAAV